MKNLIYIVLACCLTSCFTSKVHKDRSKENKKASIDLKSKTDTKSHTDSGSVQKTTATNVYSMTTTIDTNIKVAGDTSKATGKLPKPGGTTILTDGDVTTELGLDTFGNVTVKTMTKPKEIPVHKTTFITGHSEIKGEVQTNVSRDEKTSTQTHGKYDSSSHRVWASKDKQIETNGRIVLIASLLFLLLFLIIFFWLRRREKSIP